MCLEGTFGQRSIPPRLTCCTKVCVTGMLMAYRLQARGTDGIWLQDGLTGRSYGRRLSEMKEGLPTAAWIRVATLSTRRGGYYSRPTLETAYV